MSERKPYYKQFSSPKGYLENEIFNGGTPIGCLDVNRILVQLRRYELGEITDRDIDEMLIFEKQLVLEVLPYLDKSTKIDFVFGLRSSINGRNSYNMLDYLRELETAVKDGVLDISDDEISELTVQSIQKLFTEDYKPRRQKQSTKR